MIDYKTIIIFLALLVSIPIQFAYAGGPRYDSPDDTTLEGGQCWVDGYDAGFAGKYDEDRADECTEKGDDLYNSSWPHDVMTPGTCQMNVQTLEIIQPTT